LPNQYFLPNSITPNGDQINDEFKLVGFVNFKSYSLKVYNRWGEMMFNSIDPKQGWNGTFMGEIVPMGSYIYIMEFEDWTGKKVELKGFVSILR
ncbi:MAG: gliding motility-associated C-terminal domain-containing protein, partial [Bacteroidetes bacterium]|nr:gliding motility-associated C-terminal domain-containing protein [Bacteroidota bacterium]